MLKKIFTSVTLLSVLIIGASCTQPENRDDNRTDERTEPRITSEASDKPQVAVLVTEGFHDAEAYMPIGYLTNKGFDIVVIGPETGRVKAYNSDFEIVIDKAVNDVNIADFDGLVIPGGRAPAALKEHSASINFARDFFNSGKTVAAVCHGPQVLAAAGVLDGVTTTATGSIREELELAGATYVDEPLQVDGNLITSRVPDDLPYFAKAVEDALSVN